ncbi:MAG: tRNA 2-selenouridine(34) synthase MnmH, partial [Saprospiraceae bacterium]
SVYLPQAFWDQMKAAPLINIEIPLEERIDILVNMYGNCDRSLLVRSFEKIKKRLGGQNLKEAMAFLEEGNLKDAAQIALTYYDKSYQRLLEKNDAPDIIMKNFEGKSPLEIAESLKNNTTLFVEAKKD